MTGLDLELLDADGLDRWIDSRARALGMELTAYEGRLLEDKEDGLPAAVAGILYNARNATCAWAGGLYTPCARAGHGKHLLLA